MTEHLPECPVEKMLRSGRTVGSQSCICEHLRACEDRVARAFQVVRKDDTRKWEKFSLDQFDAGFSEGLDAAIREAVAALPEYRMRDTCIAYEGRNMMRQDNFSQGLWIGWAIGTLMLLIPIIVLAVSND